MADNKSLLKEFKEFVMTGDLVSIAVAFVMAGALKDLIEAFIKFIFNGIIGAILPGKTGLDGKFIIADKIFIGAFISAIIAFLALAFVVFLLVKAYKTMVSAKTQAGGPTDNALLTEIRDLLAKR